MSCYLNGFRRWIDFMKRIVTFAVFAFLVSSYPALAQESNNTGPVRLIASRVQAPASVIKPKLIPSPPPVGDVGAGQDAPQPQSEQPASSHRCGAATKQRRAPGTPARRV